LILADRLEWTPPAPSPPLAATWWWLAAGLLAAAVLGWRELQRRDRAARRLLRELERGDEAAQTEAESRTLFRDLENR
jgi:HAMP domain-containing protein